MWSLILVLYYATRFHNINIYNWILTILYCMKIVKLRLFEKDWNLAENLKVRNIKTWPQLV